MPRMIKSNQTAYITSRYDHHSFLRSTSLTYFSGPILQKLLQNMQTILVRWLQSRATPHHGIEKRFQNPLHLWDPSRTHQARRCNFFALFRKEEWLINSIEITNCFHTILTQPNYSSTNSEIIISDKPTSKPIKSKKDKTPFSLLSLQN